MNARINNQKGFSLIELMVVVAIIGILASIAVPNVLKFMAKARQAEVKTLLSGIYTSEKGFYAEYSKYHSKFEAIGFSPEGQIRYNVGFATSADPTAADGYNGAGGAFMDTLAYCTTAMVRGCQIIPGVTGANPPGIPAAGAQTLTTFTAAGTAVIYKPVGGAAQADVWTMSDSKILSNPTTGIQ